MSDSDKPANWHFEHDADNLVWLTLDKTDASTNVLSGDLMLELNACIDEIGKSAPRAMIVRSAKKSGFIAGADIKEFTGLKTAQQAFELIRRGQQVLERISNLPFPTVAMIHGFALGGGLELALACRYRVARDDDRTSLGLPEVKLGIHPGFGGTVRSVQLVGVLPAMDMMLTGRSLSGRKAKSIGLVDRLVPESTFMETARAMALNPPEPCRAPLTQRLLNFGMVRPFVAKMLKKKVAEKVNPAHYPAPYAIIDLWQRYGANPDSMYLQEAHSIANLMTGDTARNLVRVFLLQDRLKSLGRKSDLQLRHIHVVGAGTMGGDIAAWCALKGFTVTLQDRGQEYIEPALKRAGKLFSKKLHDPAQQGEAAARLRADVAGDGVTDADVVIEAIFENAEAKQDLYKKLEQKMRPDAILATNTSSIRLETLSSVLDQPTRLVGLHFFNPVAKMPLVEVIHADATNPDMIARALAFTRHIDRLPVPVKSSPGFLVNRILMPYLTEAMAAAGEGIALEAIDKAALDFGMPMGPAELADTVGLDVALSVAKIFAKEFNKQIPVRLTELVDHKKLGRKTGEGFYRYQDGKPVKDAARAETGPEDLTDRLILPMLNEAVAVLREGIVEDADLLDAGVIFGTGFAPFRGGPVHYIQATGPAALQGRLENLKARYGDRFTPDAGWTLPALKGTQQ